ncbi:MAG TPA: type II toxin-antitoxin system PemK/MazF family toxin [Mycobacteriales bacterium]|nr:type II toxin-antitoxin system PemK/MazF family toxin [Mycobacteriales bacterium]
MSQLVRGRVYSALLSGLDDIGEKYYVVVSNNRRNRALESVLAVRLTTSAKPNIPSIVETVPSDPVVGRVLCDDVVELWPDEVRRDLGSLSVGTMRRVADGLRAAFDI